MTPTLWKKCFVLALLGTLSAWLGLSFERGPAFGWEDGWVSPDHHYRIEYHRASWLQSLRHMDDFNPGFARLYDNRNGRLLGETVTLDLDVSGPLDWLPDCYEAGWKRCDDVAHGVARELPGGGLTVFAGPARHSAP